MTHFSSIQFHVGTMGLSFCSLLFDISLPKLCPHFSMNMCTSSASSTKWLLNPFASLDKREEISVLLTEISHVRLAAKLELATRAERARPELFHWHL